MVIIILPAGSRKTDAGTPNIQHEIRYSRPQPSDVSGQDYDAVGRITAQYLLDLSPYCRRNTSCAVRLPSWLI